MSEWTRLATLLEGRSIEQIFGYPDDMKFRSSMTLFAQATPDNEIFMKAIAKYFAGKFDQSTLDLI